MRAIVLAALIGLASSAAWAQQATDNWRAVATPRDARKIANLQQAWDVGLREAVRANPVAVRALGVVARPAAGLARPHPAPGTYRCRTIKLGDKSEDGGFIAYGWFRCRVELTPGGDLILSKTTGSQRQRGLFYPYSSRRLAFVGTLALSSSETSWPRYGASADRNVAGVFERIGTGHYRLVMPQPEYESELDILELRR